MIQLTHASVFSGIGAPEIAAEMLGWQNLFHCEINPFGRSILDYYFPNSKSYEDIKKTDFSEWRGKIDILTGGFPCQPFSYAGKRKGAEDDRYLWPYMLRCIKQVQPTWFIGENVVGITTMVFPNKGTKVASDADLFGQSNEIYETRERYVLDEICENLEQEGYSVQPLLIPACAVGAPHRRDRVWIIAHRDSVFENAMHGGQLEREHDEQGSEWDIRNSSARNNERICNGASRTESRTIADTESMQRNGSEFGERRRSEKKSEFGNDNSKSNDFTRTEGNELRRSGFGVTTYTPSERRRKIYAKIQSQFANGDEFECFSRERITTDSNNERCEQTSIKGAMEAKASSKRQPNYITDYERLLPANRWRSFPTVSPVYRGNDGLPFDVDNLTIPFSKWKKESLKAYGNAWCVQVGYEIMRAIGEIETNINNI